jgi:NAD(P)-dependent dehydrogenase (short-subunit alcohol dehydrogenase family)
MDSFPAGFRALVIGSTGAIGAAFMDLLQADPRCASVQGLHRHSLPKLDFHDEASIAVAAAQLSQSAPFHLIINATGILHNEGMMPEKRLADLCMQQMLETFRINTFGPALLLRHFTPLLAKDRSVMAMLSAKVGSIGDNRLGGWYSYRASKSALNMLVKTAAIEISRTKPGALLIALHPGTVNSSLSKPFRGAEIGRAPHIAAAEMLEVINGLSVNDSGEFFSFKGQRLPW